MRRPMSVFLKMKNLRKKSRSLNKGAAHHVMTNKTSPCKQTLQPTPLKSCFKKEETTTGPLKSVRFHEIRVREFPMILGDHPSTTHGIPITIDWNPQEKDRKIDLEVFESHRKPRNSRKELLLNSERRVYLALAGGSSIYEILKEARYQAVMKEKNETKGICQ